MYEYLIILVTGWSSLLCFKKAYYLQSSIVEDQITHLANLFQKDILKGNNFCYTLHLGKKEKRIMLCNISLMGVHYFICEDVIFVVKKVIQLYFKIR